MNNELQARWGTTYHRRTIYVPHAMFQRMQAEATQAGVNLSEYARQLIMRGLSQPIDRHTPDPTGPFTDLVWVYLPPALDRRIRALAHTYQWSLTAAARRVLAQALSQAVPHD